MMPNHIMMSAPAGGANGPLQRMDEGQASQIKQKQAVEIAQHTMDALPLYGLRTLCTADSPPPHPQPAPRLSVVWQPFVFPLVQSVLVKHGTGTLVS